MTKKRYNTIIWDWNGTLLDDVWLAIEVMNNMLKKRKLKRLELDHYRDIFDFPVKDYYQLLGFDLSKESFEILGNEFITLYDQRHFECKLRSNSLECIIKFKNANLGQYVLSARNQIQLEEEMKYFNIMQHFKTFSGLSHNYANGKVELGRQLLENENIQTDKTVLIGDTTHDFEVANELRIDCILIEGGHHSQQRLTNCGVKVINDLDQLEIIDI